MANNSRGGNPPPSSGEVILRGERPSPMPAQTGKSGAIGWLLSRVSRSPFNNRLYVKSLKAANEVLEAQQQLRKTYLEHEEIREQVEDLPTTIAHRRLQRLREFFGEERRFTEVINHFKVELEMMGKKNKMRKDELTIQEIEQKKRLRQAKKELEELQKPPSPPPPAPPPVDKQKLREDACKRFDKEVKRIDAMKKATPERKTDLKKSAQSDLEKELERIDRMP
jgi:hypothetical protein